MTGRLTNKRFAQQASFLAREISGWAGETLAFADADQPMDNAALRRFLDFMRERLDRIEHFEDPVV